MGNVNFQNFLQIGSLMNDTLKQATGIDAVQAISMDHITVEQNQYYLEHSVTGSIAEFETNIEYPLMIDVDINPVQDLHGYDYPWAGGCGKNLIEPKLPTNTYNGITFTNNGDGSFTFSGTASSNATFRVDQSTRTGNDNPKSYSAGDYTVSGLETGISLRMLYLMDSSTVLTFDSNGTQTLANDANTIALFFRVESGVSFANPVTIKPMLEKGNSASSWQPYSNICAITGWTGANVYRTGDNMIPTGTDTNNGYIANKYLKSDNTTDNPSPGYTMYVSEYFPVSPDTEYSFGFGIDKNFTSWTSAAVCFYDADKTYISGVAIGGVNTKYITTPSNAKYARSSQCTSPSAYKFIFGHDRKYIITFPDPPETVYSGTLTVNRDGTGTLVVTDANIASYNGETLPSTWISSEDVYAPESTPTIGAQVVYKLETPVTYTLTAEEVGQIKSLVGVNNVWADIGNVTVTYTTLEEYY